MDVGPGASVSNDAISRPRSPAGRGNVAPVNEALARFARISELFAVLAERHAHQMIDMDLDELVD